MRLRSRVRKLDEILQELASDVECLAGQAYPDARDEMLEVNVKDQFLDSLQGDEIRLRITRLSEGFH